MKSKQPFLIASIVAFLGLALAISVSILLARLPAGTQLRSLAVSDVSEFRRLVSILMPVIFWTFGFILSYVYLKRLNVAKQNPQREYLIGIALFVCVLLYSWSTKRIDYLFFMTGVSPALLFWLLTNPKMAFGKRAQPSSSKRVESSGKRTRKKD